MRTDDPNLPLLEEAAVRLAPFLPEIADSPSDLREYLAAAAKGLLNEPRFLDALPGFVLNDERVPLIRRRLVEIANLSPTAGR